MINKNNQWLWLLIVLTTSFSIPPTYAKEQTPQIEEKSTKKESLLTKKQVACTRKKRLQQAQAAKKQQRLAIKKAALEKKKALAKQKITRHHAIIQQPTQTSFVREQVNELLRSTAHFGVIAAIIGGSYYISNNPFKLDKLILPIVINLATDPLKSIGKSMGMLFAPPLTDPKLRQALTLKKQYEQRKHTLSASMRNFTERIIHEHIWILNHFGDASKAHEDVIKEVLQFPIGPKQITPDIAQIRDCISTYPLEVRRAIGAFVASTGKDATQKELIQKGTPMMFVGPPGTGKTYLAKQTGKLLGLPIQVIDLSKYKNIGGAHFWSPDPEVGIVAETLIGTPSQETNWSNKIIILDEIDKALATDANGRFICDNGAAAYSLLHALLEPQEVALPVYRYRNARPDISHLKIILVANRTFTAVMGKEKAAALESRVKLVQFEQGFASEQKKEIVTAKINELCAKQQIDPSKIDQKVIDAIIAADTGAGIKGIRILLSVINTYITQLQQGDLINAIAGTPPTPFDVEKAYLPYIEKTNNDTTAAAVDNKNKKKGK